MKRSLALGILLGLISTAQAQTPQLNLFAGSQPLFSQPTGQCGTVQQGAWTCPAQFEYNRFTNVSGLRGANGPVAMQVYVQGTSTPNDGGQGNFYWNSTSVAADDNGATTIQPTFANALAPGRWIRLGPLPSNVPTLSGNNTWTGTNNFTSVFKIAGVTQTFPASGALVGTTDSQTLTGKSIDASEVNSGTLGAARMPAFTGDVTTSAGATATTLATVNGSPGTFANATLTVNNKGLVTAASTGTSSPPGGRLTLSTGKPVMIADVTAATTIFYDTYVNNIVPVGTTLLTITADEVSMGLSAANILSGSLYDVFAISNAGSLAICAGTAWSSTTARAVAIALNGGFWKNSGSLTHCWGGGAGTTDFGAIGANNGTYLGTFFATANGQTGMQFTPAAAAGGSNSILALWNAYNRVPANSLCLDNTATWTFAVANTWRRADNSSSNRIRYVDGLAQTSLRGRYDVVGINATNNPGIGIERDWSTGAPSGQQAFMGGNTQGPMAAENSWAPALGLHEIDALEFTLTGGTSTFYGSGALPQSEGLFVSLDM